MACGKKTGESWQRVLTTSTATYSFLPTTDWMLACGIDSARMVLKLKNSTTVGVDAAYQTATTRPDAPNAWKLFGAGGLKSDGEAYAINPTVYADTVPAFFVRWGIGYTSNTANTLGTGDASLQVAFEPSGRIVGSRKIEVNIGTSGSYDEPFTEWLPAESAQVAKYAILMTDASAYLQCQPIFQAATTSVESPGAWTTFGAVVSRTGASTEACTVEMPATGISTSMWVRFGLRISASGGHSAAWGVLSAVVAAKPC